MSYHFLVVIMKNLIVISVLALLFLSNGLFSQTGITSKRDTIKYIPFGKAEPYTLPDVKGITTNIPFMGKVTAVGKAENMNGFKDNKNTILAETEWILLDSIYVESIVPPSGNLGVILNTGTRTLELIHPLNLTTDAINAIKKAPKWLRPQLEYTLSKLNGGIQNLRASIINNATDPFIDEIAYTIAYTTPEFLASDYFFPNLFLENAQLVYAHDTDLAYVDIVDYGTSTSDENYYSTVKYWKIDKDSNRVQIEVPKEIYYMYIVHPKITDEYEAYVNPTLAESNYDHTTNIDVPPYGVFWRDYLYSHTEQKPDTTGDDFPILKDEASKCQVLWDEKNAEPSAIRTVTKWINDVMEFNSGTERPHQPVRIYSLHLGRCGEHEDITAAAARSCLIPARGIDAISSDHVWNEFWDEQWWQWEPVNNSHKDNLVYEKGWGKKFGSIVAHRSDGVAESVTNTYSEKPCTINLFARDSHDQPIDGATFLLAVQGTLDQSSIFIDSYAITDNNGLATFTVVAGQNYFARLNSSLGNVPAQNNQVVELVKNPQAGGEYSYILRPANFKTITKPTVVQYPDTPSDEYLLKVNYNAQSQNIKWSVLFNDFGGSNTSYEKSGGKANFYLTDEYNYNLGKSNSDYSVIASRENASNISCDYKFVRWQEYFAWLKNLECISNSVEMSASFSLYVNLLVDVNETQNTESQVNCYPNPMSNNTQFKFNVQDESNIRLSIYDIQGIKIKTIAEGMHQPGNYSLDWNGCDEQGNHLSNGMYFYQLDINGRKKVGKLMVVR